MYISKDKIEAVAALAKLHLTDEEKKELGDELASIFEYFKSLDGMNTENIEPLFNPVAADVNGNVWREDEITTEDISDDLLAEAPQAEGRYILVPQVVDSPHFEGEENE